MEDKIAIFIGMGVGLLVVIFVAYRKWRVPRSRTFCGDCTWCKPGDLADPVCMNAAHAYEPDYATPKVQPLSYASCKYVNESGYCKRWEAIPTDNAPKT